MASVKQGLPLGGSKGGGDHRVEAYLWEEKVSSFFVGSRVNSPNGGIVVYRIQWLEGCSRILN